MAETDPLEATKEIIKIVNGMTIEDAEKAFKMALVYLGIEELF